MQSNLHVLEGGSAAAFRSFNSLGGLVCSAPFIRASLPLSPKGSALSIDTRQMKRLQKKMAVKPGSSYLLHVPLVIFRIVLEDVCTRFLASPHFPLLITSVSFTKLIGKPSSTFASFRKHAAMNLSTCSSAASRSMIVPLLGRVNHQRW
jgi:hypothetical protein